MPQIEDDPVVETTSEARAGLTGTGARHVLAISTIGIAVIFVGVYLYFFT